MRDHLVQEFEDLVATVTLSLMGVMEELIASSMPDEFLMLDFIKTA